MKLAQEEPELGFPPMKYTELLELKALIKKSTKTFTFKDNEYECV